MKLLFNLRRKRHLFFSRRKLRHQILELSKSNELKLNIGSGGTVYDSWLNLDLPFFDLTREDLWEFFFSDAPINNILMEHVLEHLTDDEVKTSLELAKKYLHKNALIRIAVPDKNHPNPAYIEHVRPGGSGVGADDHKSFWNYSNFTALLDSLNFKYTLKEYYDENGNLNLGDLNPESGVIGRTAKIKREGPLEGYSSLIVDFWLT